MPVTSATTVAGRHYDMQTVAPSPLAPGRRVKLLIVNSTLHIGGAEQISACLAGNVSSKLFDTSACYLKRPGLIADQMLRAGVDLSPIPGLKPGRLDYLTFLKLRKLIRQRDIQVIHTHDIHGMIDGAACRLTMRDLRFVHTFHYGNYPERKPRHKLIECVLSRVADALVAVSHSQAIAIRKLYKIRENRIRVIWNGVEEPSLAPCAGTFNQGISDRTPIIASVSTLIPQKGLEYLLEAAAMLRESGEQFTLLIAGDGTLRESLMARADKLGLNGHVKFLGWVPSASIQILPFCDIFVQSSLWEAMSVVVLEAMAAAKPMVVTSGGENRIVVVQGETGLIVPPADPKALADGLRTLLHDAALRVSMGRAARLRYEQCFTMRQMITAYEQLYSELMSARR